MGKTIRLGPDAMAEIVALGIEGLPITAETDHAGGALTDMEQAIVADAHNADLTAEYVQSRIVDLQFYVPGNFGGTLCHLTLDNGHVVRGESSCPNPIDAQGLAYTEALNRVWELLRFSQAEARFGMGLP